MADIRIKDLTTEAPASVTTDFLPIDGNTGTRKLSAFSPSFGGNATVGGTLTVSGASVNSSGTNSVVKSTDGAVVTKVQSVLGSTLGIVGTESNHDLGVYTNNTNRLNISAAGVVSISGTTASTTTSSGALVVGNGTSGGLGVGGAITAGGTLRVIGSSQIIRVRHDASNIEFTNTAQDAYVTGTVIGNTLQLHGNNGTGLTIGSTGNATVGGSLTVSGTTTADGLATSGFFGGSKRVIVGYNTSSDYGFIASVDTGIGWKELHLNPVGGVVKVPNTAASNNTSSGALVVSGGVGVAGVVYSGGFFGNAVDVSSTPVTYASSGGCVMSYSGSGVGVIRPYANASGTGTSSLQLRPSGTLAVTVSASTVELAGGIDLKLGNAYAAGAPTATGYIVIKDSTGTSYKIPAQAL